MAERRCPRCGDAVAWEGNPHRPFCSARCRLVDLEGWLGGRYAIPGEP
ncbi:MAG: DNA gyrase inhibitor YacG, partial [Alphaproteobacteria bacterium]